MTLKERRTRAQRLYAGIAIFLAVIMGVSLILPLLSQNAGVHSPQTIPPTATPRPTVPAPIEDLNSVQFEEAYLHPSGLFTASIPTGFVVTNANSTTGEAIATMRNGQQLGVVELRVVRPVQGQDITTAEGLSEIFNENWLRDSWREYTSWNEDNRRLEEDTVVIDFSLERSGQDFIARQEAFADDQWVYAVRVVAPSNASDYLQFVLANVRDSFAPIERYIGTPIEWTSYFDEAGAYLVRYPSLWQVTDSVTGGPTSITADGVQLLVDTESAVVDSADAASEWVANSRPGVEVLSAEEVDQYGSVGYQVAYQVETLDGDVQSGLAILIGGEAETYTANLLLTDSGAVDLSSADVPAEFADAVEAVQTLSLLPDLQVAEADSDE